MSKKKIPFDFVIDRLFAASPVVRPMFGAFGIYVGPKIYLALRQKEEHTEDNGVWVSTLHEHHDGLKALMPSLRQVQVLGGNSAWLIVPEDHPDFETHANMICDLILRNDPRLGSVPKKKKKK